MPYRIRIGTLSKFPEHRHADIEFNFCIEGSFDILIDKKKYYVGKECMTLIGPMSSHEIPSQSDNGRSVMTVIVGTSFLRKHFNAFSKYPFSSAVIDLCDEEHDRLKELILETASLTYSDDALSELQITGNLYKICAHLLMELSLPEISEKKENVDARKVENIEKALELIYYNYKEELTVERAATVSGYGKSNFCKIFKSIVGESFHQALNRQRVKNACGFLSETNMTVADIAAEVGFAESKSFCRVFKEFVGSTPGEYRKMKSWETE